MAPSTDEFLNYISEHGSAVFILLILVNMVIVSSVLLLSCTSCYKSIQKNSADLAKNETKEADSTITRATVRLSRYTKSESGGNGSHHDVPPPDAETTKTENGTAPKPLENGSATTSTDMIGRALPQPPQEHTLPSRNHPDTPIPLEDDEPLYDSVNEMKEKLNQNQPAPKPDHVQTDNNIDETRRNSLSKTIRSTEPQSGDDHKSQSLEYINPIYNSVDMIKEQSSAKEVLSVHLQPETKEKNVDCNTLDPQSSQRKEPLYSIVRKKSKSNNNSLEQNTTKLENSPEEMAGEGSISLVENNQVSNNNPVENFTNKKQPIPTSASTKLNMVLKRTKQRSIKFNPSLDSAVSIQINEQPPPVPNRSLDL